MELTCPETRDIRTLHNGLIVLEGFIVPVRIE